jgi:hypothetical protein
MSLEGRKVTHPTPDHPSYYVPIAGGYLRKGAIFAGEAPPAQGELLRLASLELAKHGYQKASAAHPPDMIVVVHWGDMNPELVDVQLGSQNQELFFNDEDMINLVAGLTVPNITDNLEAEQTVVRSKENRYFIVITAFDYAATLREKRKVPLWQEKMSVQNTGPIKFDSVAGVLLEAGGPLLGRETRIPQQVSVAVAPEGSVLLGSPTVVDQPAAPAGPPADK